MSIIRLIFDATLLAFLGWLAWGGGKFEALVFGSALGSAAALAYFAF